MVDLSRVRVTGPLQPCAHGFREQLTELGYTRLSAADQLRLMAHLSRWLTGRRLGAGQLTPQRAEQFLRAAPPGAEAPRARGPNLMLSMTLMWGNSAASWKTRPMCRRSGGRSVMSVPARLICPEFCGRSPAMVSSSIVLPAPDGPSTASTRLAGISRLTGPSLKDPAWAPSPVMLSPESAVGTIYPGEQPA